MNDELIARYQRGGDIYETLAEQFGTSAANRVASAATSGDRVAVTNALALIKNGAPLNDSWLSIFGHQITTDPFGAPADAVNSQLGKAFKNLFKSPWIVLALALVGVGAVFYFFGNPFKKK